MTEATAKGVDALIARLRDDGVAAGRAEAARLIAEAKAEAAEIRETARAEAERHRAQVRDEADTYRAAGEQALDTAMRDAVLRMKAGVESQLRDHVQRLVSACLADEDLLKRMILEVAGVMRAEAQSGDTVEVILPPAVLGPEQIREQAGDIRSGELTQYVLGLTGEMLRGGVTLHAGDEGQSGIRLRVQDGAVEIDLTDTAIAALLLEHMQPRFRAVLEGVIRS
ncbi:hypothetical protein [Marinibacterium profundimaris]|uniref:ATP synthase subunit E n=1 Tax=Marinibacterium profundimaris TaxID=1679460 RepID=A0A225NML9_9RHOB|nr:hypothetical protein [Marinibacterium profundimaris]OWU75632.1 hypothetical protein ATO3_05290 [Marinibacterium profundimaris]